VLRKWKACGIATNSVGVLTGPFFFQFDANSPQFVVGDFMYVPNARKRV
jgi:hypothetical protein